MKNDSILGFAVLGLLSQQPMSGYDLRKIFASTAMGSFSDSPGAIYPALARLEAQGRVRGAVRESSGLRQRKIYKLTAKGVGALKGWLKRPITRDDVVRHDEDVMLRFAFMDQVLGPKQTLRFLREFEREIAAYLPTLQQFLEAHASEMPQSGRLALECGIGEYAMRLRWARSSAALYEQGRRNRR
jgi:DNA-binding PadR family transcriptional regulator